MGFEQGVASPCCFYHPVWRVSLVVHGDDFTALGTDPSLQKFEDGMAKFFEVKLKGRIGPEAHDQQEMKVLNLIERVVDHGLLYEPDPGHVELLVRAMGLEGANSRATPGETTYIVDEAQEEQQRQPQENLIDAVIASRRAISRNKKVSFAEDTETINSAHSC